MKISRYKTLFNKFLIMCRLKRKVTPNGFKTAHTSEYMRQRKEIVKSMLLCRAKMCDTYILSVPCDNRDYKRELIKTEIDDYNQELLLLDAKKELKLIQA